ncbi:MAG: asparagine synthase (glutamine-hydrolyzing) [Polyangiales bacterium]
MCGISASLAVDPHRPADLDAVRRMNAAQTHRGPDAEGLWSAGPCALGHRRLSIIDLSDEARQPLVNEDGTVAVVVNGEIYNFATLREELRAKGHTFRSQSDSEVVVHLWEEHGPDAVAKLHGMFALALFDAKQQTLLLARDRAGKKPLFWRRTARAFTCASELAALLQADPMDRPGVDLASIDAYLSLGYVPSPRSAFDGVHKLPAAHYALVRPGEEPTLHRYWSKPRGPLLTGDTRELARELRRLLAEAVRRRMVADVPLGAFLSGGLDSSAVVALLASQSSRPVKTFSIGFPQADFSEVTFARQVAQRYGTEHEELVVTPAMVDVVQDLSRHHGEPFADSSAVATWYLAKMTRRRVTVALSGDGGDEAFAGYRRYATARWAQAWDALPRALQPGAQRAVRAVGAAVYPFFGQYAARWSDGEAARYALLVTQFSDDEKEDLYEPALRVARTDAVTQRFASVLGESAHRGPMGRVADLDWQTYMVDDINVKVDIASMAHALEVRCPFLDTGVVEFAARLPDAALMRLRGKYLLREAVKELVPPSILRRRKMGFGIPLAHWMKHDLKPLVRETLLGARARTRGLFRADAVARYVDSLDGPAPQTDRVWTLLMLELWYQNFIDAPPAMG